MADTAVRGAYRFGPFHLDVRERRLSRGGEVIPLRLKVFDTLLVLVENAGRLVTKQELLDTVWPETTVEENNLNHNVSVLRKALGRKPRASSTSRPCRAWAIASPHRSKLPSHRPEPPLASAAKARQEIRYCTTSDGVRLAYATTGNGPPLVKASNWLTHLDFEWGSPIWRHWYAALSLHHRLVRYDERGNGMSQRDVPDVSFDTWVRDLETVVDAAGLDRFPLLGISRGGPIAIAYAVKHPERVTHLVLYGAFAAGLNHVGTPQRARGAARAREPVAAWVGTQQPGVLQDVHLSVHPRGDAGARAVVRRTPARVHVAGKRGATHGARRRHRCSTTLVAGEDADARHPLRSRSRSAAGEGSPAGGRDPGCAVRLAAERESPDARGGARLVSVPRGARSVPELVGVAHYEETIQGVDGVLTWTVDGPPIDVGLGQPRPKAWRALSDTPVSGCRWSKSWYRFKHRFLHSKALAPPTDVPGQVRIGRANDETSA